MPAHSAARPGPRPTSSRPVRLATAAPTWRCSSAASRPSPWSIAPSPCCPCSPPNSGGRGERQPDGVGHHRRTCADADSGQRSRRPPGRQQVMKAALVIAALFALATALRPTSAALLVLRTLPRRGSPGPAAAMAYIGEEIAPARRHARWGSTLPATPRRHERAFSSSPRC